MGEQKNAIENFYNLLLTEFRHINRTVRYISQRLFLNAIAICIESQNFFLSTLPFKGNWIVAFYVYFYFSGALS